MARDSETGGGGGAGKGEKQRDGERGKRLCPSSVSREVPAACPLKLHKIFDEPQAHEKQAGTRRAEGFIRQLIGVEEFQEDVYCMAKLGPRSQNTATTATWIFGFSCGEALNTSPQWC